MAVENGVEESYQQFNGTSSTSGFVGQLTGTANDENGTKNKDSHGEQPHSSILDTGSSKKNEKYISNTEHEKKAKRRTSDCKLHLNSPRERESRLHSRGQSRRKSRSPSGSSSSSSRSRSRTYKSRSRSTSRSASHGSRHRRYKRSSRSSSRSRSRSPGSRYRRHHSRSHRSPRRYNRSRSRSRSHVKVYYGRYRSRSRSRSCSRGRRRYGFVHRPRPATFRSRSRTRSISRSRSLHLTEKDRLELLEIAKANAAKALGKSVDLPPSLKKNSWLSDTLHRSLEWDFTKLNKQSRNLNNTVIAEVSPQKAANVSSIDSTVVHPVLNKQVNSLGSSPKKEEPKKAQGQWIPIQCQRSLNRLR